MKNPLILILGRKDSDPTKLISEKLLDECGELGASLCREVPSALSNLLRKRQVCRLPDPMRAALIACLLLLHGSHCAHISLGVQKKMHIARTFSFPNAHTARTFNAIAQ
jgi:hypothetical protein